MSRQKEQFTRPKLYKQPASKMWYCSFSINGHQIRKSCGTSEKAIAKNKAHSYLQEALESINSPQSDPKSSESDDLLIKYLLQLQKLGRSESTLRNYTYYFERFLRFRDKPLWKLTRNDMEEWRDWLLEQDVNFGCGRRGKLSQKSVSEHLNFMATLLKYYDLPNVTANVERPKKKHSEEKETIKIYTKDQWAVIKKNLPDSIRNACIFLYFTGTRSAEMRGIKKSEINYEKHTVTVTGKGSKVRTIGLNFSLSPAWDAMVSELERVDNGEYVFNQYEKFPYKHLQILLRGLNIDSTRCVHRFRHTFASRMIEAGESLAIISKHLGHESIDTTLRIYGHLIGHEFRNIDLE